MSPEQIHDQKYNENSDIWSLGCIIYELCALRPPFQAQNPMALAIKIKDGRFDRIPTRYSEELQRVICWMLTLDQQKRASIDDLINLPLVSVRLREKRFEDKQAFHFQLLKKKEIEICKREEKLKLKEKMLQELDKNCKEKDNMLSLKDKRIKELEKLLASREQQNAGTQTVAVIDEELVSK